MLTKSQISDIRALHEAQGRKRQGLFLVEGPKMVTELLESDWRVQAVFALEEAVDMLAALPGATAASIVTITKAELGKISALVSPNLALATVAIPTLVMDWHKLTNDLTLMLDGIKDPGNLGTIIRIADWFGISQIICSHGSVDVYNTKTVQASMGSLFRVRVFYEKLPEFLADLEGGLPVLGTFPDGPPLETSPLPRMGILLLGSESHGISEKLYPYITRKLSIPSFPPGSEGPESLNASVACGILCHEFRKHALNTQSLCP